MSRESLSANGRWIAGVVIGIGMLAVTSRRWSATLLASALGMGLFIGVAFGPATDGVSALGRQILAIAGGEEEPPAETVADSTGASTGGSGAGGGSGGSATGTGGGATGSTVTSAAPAEPVPTDTPVPTEEPVDSGEEVPPPADPADPPADDEPLSLGGIVVGVNPIADSYTVSEEGELYAIHARKLPEVGQRLEVATRYLANGTYAETDPPDRSGTEKSAPVNGFVTYVAEDAERPFYTLSARGVSLLVRLPEEPAADEVPKLGAFVETTAAISPVEEEKEDVLEPPADVAPAPAEGCAREEPAKPVEVEAELVQQEILDAGQPFTYFDVAATVQAICDDSSELVLSADSVRQGGTDMTVSVPNDVDLGLLEVDQAVVAALEVGEDDSLSLAAIAADDGPKAADDADQLQGDYAG